MKKSIMFVFLLVFTTGLVIAGGQQDATGSSVPEKKSITGVGVGYHSKNIKPTLFDETADEMKLKIPGFAINVTSYSTRQSTPFSVGFLNDFNFYFTPSMPEFEYGVIIDNADHIGTGFGVDAMLGPGINYELNPSLSLKTGLGVHVDVNYMPSSDYDLADYFHMGLGLGNITRVNWNFKPGMGLMLGFDLAYDFLGLFNGMNDSVFSGSAKAFSFTPMIAISFSNFGAGSSSSSTSNSSSESRDSSSENNIVKGSKPTQPDSGSSNKNDSDPFDGKSDKPASDKSKDSDTDPDPYD